jgi:hypothetical protein
VSFRERTVGKIVDCGIDAPERLLFMSEDQISKLPGVEPVSMKEIVAYWKRFIPAS